MSLSRRSFLKGLGATGAAASVIGPSLLVSSGASAAESTDGVWKTSGSHWGAFRARVWAGKVQEVKPLEADKYPTDMLNGIKALSIALHVCVTLWCA
ncbi:trimethylamine-N-oxide reductase [Vibrio sp. JCM 19236]|nr:trimethylamine-N-oxide reductase [Vibrio sp. JCM 19236]